MASTEDQEIKCVQRKVSKLHQVLVKDLEDCCGCVPLSLDALLYRLRFIPSYAVENSCFLHNACSNKSVTIDIIECLLEAYPAAASICMALSSPGESDTARDYYPLHLACHNDYCPSSVIKLLVKKNPTALCHACSLGNGIYINGGYSSGLPLHYYLSRIFNIHLDAVKTMVAAYPDALTIVNDEIRSTPLHTILHHPDVGNLFEIAEFLLETNPSPRVLNRYGQVPLHIACGNVNMTPGVIQLLLSYWPESSRQRCDCLYLPIHYLCYNERLDDVDSMEILTLLLGSYPEAVREVEVGGCLPIHVAARYKSWQFCKFLVDRHPESVRIMDSDGDLAFHCACARGAPETVNNLYELYPAGISTRSGFGFYPIHEASKRATGKSKAEIIKFLLEQDPTSASRTVSGGWDYYEGRLPLHMVCTSIRRGTECLDSVRLLFDAYPYSIFKEDQRGNTPIDLTTPLGDGSETAAFLKAQLAYALKARDEQAMTSPDDNNRLPLHHALIDKACLGAIKLLVRGNPAALQVADSDGAFPFHIACEFGSVSVVQFLVEQHGGRLDVCDSRKDFPLHYACRGGNCDTAKYLLEKQTPSVSESNGDDKLPIHLLLEAGEGKVDRESPECIETIWRLLMACPETLAQIPHQPRRA